MANDFTRLGFLASGTDVSPIIPALEAIWQNSSAKGVSDFNFRSVTGRTSCLYCSFMLFRQFLRQLLLLLGLLLLYYIT